MPTSMYAVEGMVCESCMAAVLENVHSLSGVTVVAMDLVRGGQSPLIVTSGTKLGADEVRDAVEHVGFGVPTAAGLLSAALGPRMSPMSDPVCGMTVDRATAADSVERQGLTHYFCGKGCAAAFRADPDKYTVVALS